MTDTIYLDNAATSFPKAPGTAEAVMRAICSPMGNPGRASHKESIDSSRILFEVRELVSRYFSFPASERILYTSGATESINIAVQGLVHENDTIVTTVMEHNAVARLLRHLEAVKGVHIEFLPSDEDGRVILEEAQRLIDRISPDLAVFTGESNVNGVMNPVEGLMDIFEERDIPYCIDAAQLTGDAVIDLSAMSCGSYCCSAHKGLLGPTGVGLLMLGTSCAPEPLVYGGTGSASSSDLQPLGLPDRYESGTRDFHGISGLKASLEYILAHPELMQDKHRMTALLYERLSSYDHLRMISPGANRGSVLSIQFTEHDLSETAHILDSRHVAQRMGMHCAPWAHEHIGTYASGGTIRLSPGPFTTEAEIDLLCTYIETELL